MLEREVIKKKEMTSIYLKRKEKEKEREKRMPNPLSEAGGASPGYQHAILTELEQ